MHFEAGSGHSRCQGRNTSTAGKFMKKKTCCTICVELTYGWFLVSIIKVEAELLKKEKRRRRRRRRKQILYPPQGVWFCNLQRDPVIRVRSGSAATELLSFLFDRTLKNGLKNKFICFRKRSKKENNRLQYKSGGGFVVALQDPVKAISGLTDRNGPTHSVRSWWCFHEVSLCFSSPGLRSPRSNTETSKTSEPRIVQWEATVCCRGALKPHKYFIFFLFAITESVAVIILHKERRFYEPVRWWKRFGPGRFPISSSSVCDPSEPHWRCCNMSASVRREELQLSKMMLPR